MTPEQMKALMTYVVDTAAAVQDYPLNGGQARHSRDVMLAAFGLRLEDARFESGDVVRAEQQPPAEPWPSSFAAKYLSKRTLDGMPLHPDHETNAKRMRLFDLIRRRRPDLIPDEAATLTRDIALMWPELKAIMEPEAKP